MIDRRAIPILLALLVLSAANPAAPFPARADAAPALRPPTLPADSVAIVSGRLISGLDGRPLAWANVVVVGTRRGVQAGEDGAFRIPAVPLGAFTLKIQLLGYSPRLLPIQVGPGENRLGTIVLPAPRAPERLAFMPQAPGDSVDLVASIRPKPAWFSVGDHAAFDVRIRNRGTRAVWLVQSVDASDAWASPRVWIEIDGPEGGFAVPGLARCGNNNGVSPADVVEVPSGRSFDPYAGGWLGANLVHGKFAKPGKYVATFHYATTERDPRKWMGGPCDVCDVPESLRTLLARVPAVELNASVEFVVAGP